MQAELAAQLANASRSGGLTGRLRRALSFNAAQTLKEDAEAEMEAEAAEDGWRGCRRRQRRVHQGEPSRRETKSKDTRYQTQGRYGRISTDDDTPKEKGLGSILVQLTVEREHR